MKVLPVLLLLFVTHSEGLPLLQNIQPDSGSAVVIPKRSERQLGNNEDTSVDVVLYPEVSGLPKPVLAKARQALKLKNILGDNRYKLFRKKLLINVNYRVDYNRDYLLSIFFGWNYFFKDDTRSMVLDLRTGNTITRFDLFTADKMPELAELLHGRLNDEIEQIIRDYVGPRNVRMAIEAEGLKVTPDDLDDFSINPRGITFYFHAGFHHTSNNIEPKGVYFVSYQELKPFLKPDSAVSQFLR